MIENVYQLIQHLSQFPPETEIWVAPVGAVVPDDYKFVEQLRSESHKSTGRICVIRLAEQ